MHREQSLLALDLPSLYDASKQSVVTLSAIGPDENELRTGTGFFVGDGTRIVTNYHVIQGAVKAHTTVTEEVFAVDPRHDLAILFNPAPGAPLKLANGNEAVGDSVAVIGSPFGL